MLDLLQDTENIYDFHEILILRKHGRHFVCCVKTQKSTNIETTHTQLHGVENYVEKYLKLKNHSVMIISKIRIYRTFHVFSLIPLYFPLGNLSCCSQ